MVSDHTSPSWRLADELGGRERLEAIVRDFYERVFRDPIIGFMFEDVELDHIVAMQVEYLQARLGSGDVEYTGDSIRRAHESLPITIGHFDRRHRLLEETLADHEVPDHVREAWVEMEQSLRDLVLQTGEAAREEMLDEDAE